MADYASLALLKELLDGWGEERTRLEAIAHRHHWPDDSGNVEQAKAEQLRECIAEVGTLFPEAKAWHAEGVVPADDETVTVLHPGNEIPEELGDAPPGRNLLGFYGRLGMGWQVCRFNFARRSWEGVAPFLGQPDEWVELPPAPPPRGG